jgi:YidC/Oxa1 family membrane protein insertase
MIQFFHTVLYQPIYNLLVLLVGIVPGGDVGLAIIGVTVIVKLVTMPLSLAAVRTQRAMKAIEPQVVAIREKHKDDKELQAKEMFALYKTYNIKPFASFLTLLIQIPVILSLYLVFRKEPLYNVDVSLLYSFVHIPATFSPLFLGLFAISGHVLVLAILAAVVQFFQARFAVPVPPKSKSEKPSMQEDLGRAMALQARYVLPLMIGAVAYTSGALALYFITSNLVMIAQELIVRRMKHSDVVEAALF